MDSQSLDLSIIDQGPIVLLCWKPSTDSTILYVTKNIFILSGYTVDELKLESKNWIDIIHPEDRHIALNHIVKITSSADHSLPKRQYRVKTKSSEVRWIEEQYKILKEDDGHSSFLMSYIIDVTERRHIESVAKQADAKWKAILDASPDQCMLLSSKGSIEYINFTFSELTRDEIIGTSVLNSVSKEYQPLVLRSFEQVMYTGKSVKYETHLKDIKGAKSSYCSTMSAVMDNGKVVNVVMVTSSVKEKRNLLLALEESLESYQLLADRLPAIVYRVLFEAGGQVEYFNERVLDITGYSQEELNDSKNCACESIIIAEDRGRVFLELDAAKKAKREYELSYCIRHKNGSKRFLLDRGQFVDQTNSCPAHFDGVIFDISERKKQEIELILSREITEKASSAKTQFLLRMSHELRTPMNAIIGYGELMRDDDRTPLSHEQHQCLHNLLTAGHHLLDIINDTIDFSRIDSGALEMYVVAIDWRIVIDRCIENITLYAKQKRVTVLDKTETRPTELILADAKRLKQVLLILLKNAVKYSNSDSEISIQNQLLTNGNMQFTVKDSGKGIPEQEQSMIFQPFNRLDDNTDVQEGVGIGLFILKHLINAMGGTMGFYSKENEGASFWIELKTDKSE